MRKRCGGNGAGVVLFIDECTTVVSSDRSSADAGDPQGRCWPGRTALHRGHHPGKTSAARVEKPRLNRGRFQQVL